MSETRARTGAGDFDFLVGRWEVANRTRTKLFVGCDEWDEFPATHVCRRFFDGAGSWDEFDFHTKGRKGMTLRLYDPERDEWSIYWSSSLTGILYPPVAGRFESGRGEFWGDDEHEGRPIRVHFTWSEITPTSARWEQEFSPDGGASWETNWVMQLTRTG